MKHICAWCGIDLGETEDEPVDGISHGICPECCEVVEKDIRGGIRVREME